MPDETTQSQDQIDPEEDELASTKMSFLEHLEELRIRLVRCALAIAVCFVAAYIFKEQLYHYLAMPLYKAMPAGSKFQFTAPAEAFFTYIKIAFLASVVGASPIIFYQLWRFISPGLYSHERRAIWPFVLVSSVLFIAGAIFAYTIVFPYAFQFFSSFVTPDIEFRPKMGEYLSFTSTLLFAFGIVFEMPLVLVFLGRIGVINHRQLQSFRKYAILVMFAAAAMFTPPDVVSQLFMAVPLMVLYEISIWLVAASEKKKAQREAEFEADLSGGDEGEG